MGFEPKIPPTKSNITMPTTHFVLFTLTIFYKMPFKWFKWNHGEYMRDEGAGRPMKT